MPPQSNGIGERLPGDQAQEPVAAGGDSNTSWSVRKVGAATLITLGIGLVFYTLYRFYMIVFLFFVAVTLAVAIRPMIDWLQRRGIRQQFGAPLILLVLLALIGGFIWAIGPLLVEQASTIAAELPNYYGQARHFLTTSNNRLIERIGMALPAVPALPEPGPADEATTFEAIAPAWQFVTAASYAILAIGAILVLAFYWLQEGELITRRALLLIPIDTREEARQLLAEMGGAIGGYFRGQAILSLIVGALSSIGYWLVGIPYALGLGIVMGIFEAVPIIGPLLGAIPAVLVALSAAPDRVIWVLVVVGVIQTLEANFLVPRVMDQSVGVNAIVTILAIAAFGALFGVVGAVLAIPLAAMIQIVINRILFRVSAIDESMAAIKASGIERNQVSKLRLQTQELVFDVRKGARTRNDTGTPEPEVEEAEDALEGIALELDGLLSRAEQAA
jgi:predicted PurR-regulated permease PerM